MIGNKKVAKQAFECETARVDLEGYLPPTDVETWMDVEDGAYNCLNRGWTSLSMGDFVHLGRGCSRSVWLHIPTMIAYKIGAAWANAEEYYKYLSLKHLSNNSLSVRIPKTRLLDISANIGNRVGVTVLAAEYIPGKPYFNSEGDPEVRRFLRSIKSYDDHPWNILITESGQKVVVDFA